VASSTAVGRDATTIEQAYRFALDARPEQEAFLRACMGASRFWFNQALGEVKQRLDRRAAGEDVSVPWSYKALCSELDARWRAELAPWQHEVVCGCYMAGFEALGAALQRFGAGKRTGQRVGFPQFKRKGACREAVLFQRPRLLDARHVELDGRRCGSIRVRERMTKLLRLLERDPRARILRATVSQRGRRWYVSFTVRRSPKQRRARRPDTVGGADLGLRHLATLSTGQRVANLRPLQAALRGLRRLQRRLDRQRRANNPGNYLPDGRVKPGARDWVKSRRMLATEERIGRLHERVANLRRHRAHALTTMLAREFGVIGVETLSVKNMQRDKRLARHIADVGWGIVLAQLRYKTSWSEGSLLVAADRFYPSSKTCSSCGTAKAKLARGETVFTCDEGACGLRLDRDHNAALNLARMAWRHAQAEGREVQLARIGRVTAAAARQPAAGARSTAAAAATGQVSPRTPARHSPKRVDPSGSSQRREAPAVA